MTDPFSIIMMIVSIAMTIYQIIAAPKPKPPPQNMPQTTGIDVTADGVPAYLPVVYGRARVNGIRACTDLSAGYVYNNTPEGFKRFNPTATSALTARLIESNTGLKQAVMETQIALAHGPIHDVVDILIEDFGPDNPNFAYRNDNTAHKNITLRNKLPTATWQIDVCKAGGVAHPNGASTNTFKDIAYAHCTLVLDPVEPQFNGMPDISFLVEGLKVQKWKLVNNIPVVDGAKQYSNNPAWCLIDYLTNEIYGKGVTIDEIDLHSFIKVANLCETVFPTQYKIGGQINAGLPALQTRKMFECNIALDTGRPMRENIDSLLSTMNGGMLTWSAGKYKLSAIHPTTKDELIELTKVNGQVNSINQLTDDDLILDQDLEIAWPDAGTRLNQVTIHFKNEARNFKDDAITWPVLYKDAESNVSSTSQKVPGHKSTYQWLKVSSDGKLNWSKWAFPAYFEQFGVNNRGPVDHGTDVYHVLVQKNSGGNYFLDAVCTARINRIKIVRMYPENPGTAETVMINATQAAAPKFSGDYATRFNTNGSKFFYNTIHSGVVTIGYYGGDWWCGITRVMIDSTTQAVLTLNNEEKYYLRIEIEYTNTPCFVESRKGTGPENREAVYLDYNPADGVVYGLQLIDYAAGEKVLWQTGQDYYQSFDIATTNQTNTLIEANRLHEKLKAIDGDLLLEKDFTIPGISTIYHAWFRGEEVVRASRFGFKLSLKYLVRNMYLEPGDIFTLNSDTLELLPYKGNWTAGSSYSKGNIVYYNNNYYIRISGLDVVSATVPSADISWDTTVYPLPFRVTASSLNEENICAISADFITKDFFVSDVDLPDFKHDLESPIYRLTGTTIKYFVFESARNSTIGSPGTLRVSSNSRLVTRYTYQACYDYEVDSGKEPAFITLAETGAVYYEVPPTTATTAIFRVLPKDFENSTLAPAYSILEGVHTLSHFGNALVLAADDNTIMYTDGKPAKATTMLHAIIDEPAPTRVYTWTVDNIVQAWTGAENALTLPNPKADKKEIVISVKVTDSVDTFYKYTDTITISLVSNADSLPLFRLKDTLLLLKKESFADNLPINIPIEYKVKGIDTALPAYTIAATGCTVSATSTGVSITAIDATASVNEFSVTSPLTVSSCKIILYSATATVVTTALDSARQYVNYKLDNTLSTANDTITFTAKVIGGNVLDYTYAFYIDAETTARQNSISNVYTYTPPASFTAMPQLLKVFVRQNGVDVAADYVSISGHQASSTVADIHLYNPLHILPINNDGTVSMTGSGTKLDVYLGTNTLNFVSTLTGASNGSYTVTASQEGLSGSSSIAVVADGLQSCKTSDYATILTTALSANIIFTVTVKDFNGVVFTYPVISQKLLKQTSVELSTEAQDLLDTLAFSHSTVATDIPIPTFSSDSFTYNADTNADGKVDGSINWVFNSVAYPAIDGFVVCYVSNSTAAQANLTVEDILKSTTRQIVKSNVRSISYQNLGTTKYQCAFVFAYRKVVKSVYDAYTKTKAITSAGDLWIVSSIARSHADGLLDKYIDRLVINADFKDSQGNLIVMSDVAANIADFNVNNNTSVAYFNPITFNSITYDSTKVNSGNIDFLVSFEILGNDALKPLSDIDAFAVLEKTTLDNTVAWPAVTAAALLKDLNTVHVPGESSAIQVGDYFRYNVPFDEAKANVFRNVYVCAYREISKKTYDSVSFNQGGHSKVKIGTRYYFAGPVVAAMTSTTYSQYTDILTIKANLKLSDGTVVSTADVYENLQDFNDSNNTSIAAIVAPLFSTDKITYDNTQCNSGNINYVLKFTHVNAINTATDSIDGFAILEKTVATIANINNVSAGVIFKDPATKFISATSTANLTPETALARTYYVEMVNSPGLAYRTVFVVAYRVVSATKAKLSTGTIVKYNGKNHICSDVARSNPNGNLDYYNGALYSKITLLTSTGVSISTNSIYENVYDFNKSSTGTDNIEVNPSNVLLDYDVNMVYPSGNVDLICTFTFTGITDPGNNNVIEGFCVGILERKDQGALTTPTPSALLKDPLSVFVATSKDVTTYNAIFKNVNPTLFRTAVVLPYRTVIRSAYDTYPQNFTSDAVKGTKTLYNKLYFVMPIAVTRSHLNSSLYQAKTVALMTGSVATANGTFSIVNAIGDFSLLNTENMAKTAALTGVTFGATPITFEGNLENVDVIVTWAYAGLEADIDGFVIDYQSSAKSNISKPAIGKVANNGYYSVAPSLRSFRLPNQNLKNYFNFCVIPYHVISEPTYQSNYKVVGTKDRICTINNTRMVFDNSYGLASATAQQYSRRDTQNASAPDTPVIGDYWLNTNSVTVSGIDSFVTAKFNSTNWEPLTAAELTAKKITQTYSGTTEPANHVGFYWKNASLLDVSGVKAGDTVSFDETLGIWVSATVKETLTIGLDSAKPQYVLEGNLYLTSDLFNGGYKLYLAKNGNWVPFKIFDIAGVSTSAPNKNAITIYHLKLAKAMTTKSQNLPTYYYRAATTDPWLTANIYDKKLIKSTTIPTRV